MAFTTLAGLSSAVYALSITGVKTKKQYRPDKVSAAQLPLTYCRLPTRQRSISTLDYTQGLKFGTIELVVWVEFLNLNTLATNDALAVTLIDTIGDVLETNAASLGMDSYEITTDEDTIDGGATPVQAIIVKIEVSG